MSYCGKIILLDFMLTKLNKATLRAWANVSYQKQVDIKLNEPIISFTFDDAPSSAFENGGRLLNKYGYQGTFYIALSFLRKIEGGVRFSPEHLEIAKQQGHELGCHTFGHLDVSQVTFSHLKEDINVNQQHILRELPGYVFRNFAFPFGAQTRASKKWLSTQYRSARGNRNGINHGLADLMNLKGVRLYEQYNSLLDIEQYIRDTLTSNGWLIFYTHAVKAPTSNDGCTPAYFEAVLKMCKDKGIKVLPVDKALDLIYSNSKY